MAVNYFSFLPADKLVINGTKDDCVEVQKQMNSTRGNGVPKLISQIHLILFLLARGNCRASGEWPPSN